MKKVVLKSATANKKSKIECRERKEPRASHVFQEAAIIFLRDFIYFRGSIPRCSMRGCRHIH